MVYVRLLFVKLMLLPLAVFAGPKQIAAEAIYRLQNGECDVTRPSEYLDLKKLTCTTCSFWVPNMDKLAAATEDVFFQVAFKKQDEILKCESKNLARFAAKTPEGAKLRALVLDDLRGKLPMLKAKHDYIENLKIQQKNARPPEYMKLSVRERAYFDNQHRKVLTELTKVSQDFRREFGSLWRPDSAVMQKFALDAIRTGKVPENFEQAVLRPMQNEVNADRSKLFETQTTMLDGKIPITKQTGNYAFTTTAKELIVNRKEALAAILSEPGLADNKFDGLKCRLESRYGQSAATVDQAIGAGTFLGSIALTGGAVGVLRVAAFTTRSAIALSRSGQLAIGAARAMTAGGMILGGVASVQSYVRECSPHMAKWVNTNACSVANKDFYQLQASEFASTNCTLATMMLAAPMAIGAATKTWAKGYLAIHDGSKIGSRVDDIVKKAARSAPVSQTEFLDRYEHLENVLTPENLRYIKLVDDPPKNSQFYVFRDGAKKANNTTFGFGRSSAFTASYNERVKAGLTKLQEKYKNQINIVYYESGNRLEAVAIPLPGKTLPAGLDKEVVAVYNDAVLAQDQFLKANGLIRANDDSKKWNRFGCGTTAHRATYSVRRNGELGRAMATSCYEAPETLADLETVFLEAKNLHRQIIDQYSETKMVNDAGFIRGEVADIVNKAETPQEIIKKLKNYYTFSGTEKEQLKQASDLKDYIDFTKQFGTEFYGVRTPLKLQNQDSWAYGSDLGGQNGRNISHTTSVFEEDNFSGVIDAAVQAEKRSTAEFKGIVSDMTSAREKVLATSANRGSVGTGQAGDDMLTEPSRAAGEPGKYVSARIQKELLNSPGTKARFRDAFVPPKVVSRTTGQVTVGQQQRLIDVTHELEKQLRGFLSQTPAYEERIFMIRMSSRGDMKLEMSRPPNMTPQDAEKYRKLEVEARRAFKVFADKNEDAQSLGLRAVPP